MAISGTVKLEDSLVNLTGTYLRVQLEQKLKL